MIKMFFVTCNEISGRSKTFHIISLPSKCVGEIGKQITTRKTAIFTHLSQLIEQLGACVHNLAGKSPARDPLS